MVNRKLQNIKRTLGVVFALLLGTTLVQAQLVSANPETLVNTTVIDSTQQNCAISMDTLGRYVVVWESEGQDGDGHGVYAKIYNADHSIRVADFLVNTSNQTNDQRFPDVAMNAEGTFCVVWQSNEDLASGQGWDCYRKLYDVDGAVVATKSRINSSTPNNQMHPAVAAGDGAFVCTYMSEVTGQNESEIHGRVLLSSGAWVMASTVIHSATGNHMAHPDVAMTPTGEYTFTWQADSLDGDRNGIYTASYDNTYTQIVSPTQVNTTTAGNQQEPRIAVDENGEFMIVWSSFNQDGDHYGIYGQRYSAPGTASGGEIAITTNTTGSQDHAAIAVTREGGKYVISWTDDTADGDRTGIYSRSMYSNGSFLANDAMINTTATDYQSFSDVAIGTDTTQAVYAWQSGIRDGVTSQSDTSYYGIYSQGFVVEDITPPTAVCQNINVYLDATGNVSIVASDVDGGSTDNIGITNMTISNNAFTCAEIGANNVTLTVYDAEGFNDNCIATVTVLDTISPTAVCQDLTVYLDGTGNVTWTASDIDNGSSDICGAPTLSADITSLTCVEVGANTVTLTATDGSGNTNTCTSTVTVLDTISPIAVCQDITVYLDGTGNVSIVGGDVDNGSSDICGIASTTVDISSFTCTEIGPNTVTLTATDVNGNTSTCVSTVTVADTTSPVVVCQNITAYLDGTGNVSIVAADVDAGSTDNCGSPTMSIDISAFNCSNTGANIVTLTGMDGSGNTNTCTATVTVLDTILPIAVCQDLTVYLDGTGNVSWTASDIDNGSSDICGLPALSVDITSLTCAEVGANTVTLTATDGSGNTNTCTSTVTVLDTISPVAVCQDIIVYLDGTGNAAITSGDLDNGSSDNCGIASTTIDISSFTCADLGANTVTLTATDGSGNTNTCVSTVTVADTTSPVVVCQDITAYLDGTGNVSIVATDVDGGSSDNCGVLLYNADVTTFTCADTGPNAVNLTVTDASGNTSTCLATVTVLDTISPVAVCQDITAYLDATGNVTITSSDLDNGSSDECGTPTLAIDINAFTCADTGANTVILSATDASGNTSTCSSTVTVLDTIAPTFAACPTNVSLVADGLGCSTIHTWTAPVESDNCGVTVTSSHNSGDSFSQGTTTVTYTATDASGNTSICSFDIIVTSDLAVTTTSTDVLCNGDSTGTGTAIGTGGVGSYIYTWSTGETGAVENTLTVGTHIVTLTDSLGCTATDSVIILEPAALALSAIVTDEMLGLDGSIDLTVTGGVPIITFDWSNAEVNEDISGLAGNVTYTVIVTDGNGCMDSLDVYVDSQVGLIDLEDENGLELVVFPNPTKDGRFSIQLNGEWIGEVKIEMVDSRGRLIYTKTTTDKILAVELENLRHGTYFIQAKDEQDHMLVRRLVTVND